MNKLNDYFLNQLYNPEFSPGDFQSIGLNSGNTSIENKENYKELDIVKNNPLLLTDGVFDEKKFDNLYQLSIIGYNLLSLSASNERLASSYSAFRDDVFAKSSNRSNLSETFITKMANPNRQSMGFVSNNIMESPKQSVREIAQSQLVWDGASNSWIEAPNDTPINNFFNPKVMAQYDEDVDINGKTSSEIGFDANNIAHKKGEKKINPLTGTYYYETLNGRDIYGRDVLSGWDTLTKDGSTINKYDFFDSDDLEKSTKGSLLKAAVKIAPALIPATSPWYVGLRVLLGTTDLLAKIGKMTTGSDNTALSYLEGINQAWTQSTSDYSRGSQEQGIESHAWSIENLLNLSADVFTLLAEQRWMFTHVPSLLKGNKLGFDKEAQEAFKKNYADKIINKYKNLENTESLNPFERAIDLKNGAMWEALYALELKLNSANKFGEHLSKVYMTGITVADSYGEAKEQGLSDVEAAIFTLGYAAGEYGILNTNLGEHILPELRAEKHRYRNIERVLREGEKTSPEIKKDTRKWYQKLIDFGKLAAVGDFNDSKIASALSNNSTAKAFGLSVASNALGEGMEEVSEELWFDIAKQLYNGAANLGLTSTGKTLETFDGYNLELVMNRYALNFVGGLAGGAIAVGLPGFQDGIKNMLGTNMDLKQAYQELVALIRNGKKDDFLRTINKLETADSNLSATEYEIIDGKAEFKPGTDTNNLDKANKTVLEGMVNLIDNLLTINGVKMDDNSVLSKLTGAKELARFQTLLGGDKVGSATLANYLLDFNTLSTKIADLAVKIDAIKHPRTDLKEKQETIQDLNLGNISALLAEMNDLIKLRDAYLNGDNAKIVIPKVLFEMSPILSYPYILTNFKDYAEKVEGKVLSEIPDERINQLEKAWENYKSSGYKDDIEYAFLNFMLVTQKFSDRLGNFNLTFLRNPRDFLLNLGNIFSQTQDIIMMPNNESEDILKSTLGFELTQGISINTTLLKTMLALDSLINNIGGIDTTDLNFIRNVGEVAPLEEMLPGDILELKRISEKLGIVFDENHFTEKDVREIKERYLKKTLYDILVNNSEKVKEVLNKIGYINLANRDFLNNNFFNLLLKYDENGEDLESLYDFDDPDFLDILQQRINVLKEYKDIINSKPITPIELLIDEFLLSVGDNNMKVSELVRTLQEQMTQKANQGVIEEFGFGTDVGLLIKNALLILDVVASNILGARSDGGKLGAIFGFNSTINQLNPDLKLTEIEKDEANTLMHDLAKLKTQLEYFLTIFNVNSGLKLEEQNKIANRINTAFIDKVNYIVSAILPEDLWNNLDENGVGVLDKLKAALNKANIAKSIIESKEDTRFNLSRDKATALEKESITVQDALYELFNLADNKTKLENGELDLSNLKLLPSTSEKSTTYNGTLIDSSLEGFDDRVLTMLLATAASVKASKFYANYKNILVDGIAPIPGLELALKMAYAFLLNKPMFLLFGNAYNNQILEEIKTVDSSKFWNNYGKNVASDGKLDNSYALLFFNTFLVEGIPGAGKTLGFQAVLYNMLKEYNPELLEDAWFVHTDKERALRWAEKLGANSDNSHFFSKQEYLQLIYPGYTAPKTNEHGVIQMTESDLDIDSETGFPRFKGVELSKTVKKPSLILIDESTRFSQQEMFVSEAFQDENDISAIATGDYDLIGAVGQVQQADGSKLFLNTSLDNFFHSPKLGTSMRTENTIKDQNIAVTRANKLKTITSLAAGSLTDPLFHLSFYLDENGLYGERIISKDSKDLDSTITLMLNTLKGEKDENGVWLGEKLSVIYQDKNSDIYKKLQEIAANNEEYKGKITFVESSAAQGDEGLYYLVDLNTIDIGPESAENLGNHSNFVNTFYTAISRSSQGTLIIENPNIRLVAKTTRVQELVKSPLSTDSISKFSKNRIDNLSSIITEEAGPIEVIKKGGKESNSGTDTFDSGTDTSDEEADELNSKRVDILNNNPKEYNMLIHSMPSMETGFVKDSNGNFVPSVGSEERIDGLNGITKIASTKITNSEGKQVNLSRYGKQLGLTPDGKLVNQDEALRVLNTIALAGLYCKDVNEIKSIIKDLLGLTLDEDSFGVDFLFMIRDTLDDPKHVEDKKKKGFLRFIKSKAETLIGIFRGNNRPFDIEEARLNKLFALNIYRVENGKRINMLTVPLAIFTNPLTMLNTQGFESLKAEFEKIKGNRNAPEQFLRMLQDSDFVNSLDTDGKINAPKLAKHLQIYTYKSMNGDVTVYLDLPLASLASSLTGPTITVKNDKGYRYFYSDEMQYNGEYTNISDIDQSVHHLTRKIYYSPTDIIINGKTVVKKGHGFVLATDFYRTLNDEDLFLLFVDKELNDNPQGRISVIYVSSPKVSITDYFKNFALKYKNPSQKGVDDPTIDSTIGNEMTEFRLSEYITKNDSPFDKYLKNLVNSNSSNKTFTLPKWELFKSIIEQVSADFESMDSTLKRNLLNTDLSKTRYINLFKYDGPDEEVKRAITSLKHVYGDGKHTLKHFISNLLMLFVLKQKGGFIDGKISWTNTGNLELTNDIRNNIAKIEESVPEKFKEGIFTQIKRAEDGDGLEIGDYSFIPSDAKNYESTLSDGTVGKYRINGKIDSTMFVMDVSPIMDNILDTINNPTKKQMLNDWYRLDKRKHTPDEETSNINVEDIVPKDDLDLFVNKGELISLILNNIKNFENYNGWGTLIEGLNKLGYTIVEGEEVSYIMVKIPKGYTQDNNELDYNLVKDNDGNYWIIDGKGNLTKPTDEFFSDIEESDLNIIKSGPESINDPELKLLATVYQQVYKLNKGDADIGNLEQLLARVENIDFMILQGLNEDLGPDSGKTNEEVIETVKSNIMLYIMDKKSLGLPDGSFFMYSEFTPPISAEFEQLIQDVDTFANNYEELNNC